MEHENILAAVSHFMEIGDSDTSLRFGLRLRNFWLAHGYYNEGIGILESALAIGNDSDVNEFRGSALVACGTLRQARGDTTQARSNLEDGLAIARKLDSSHLIADALCELAWLEFVQGNNQIALNMASEAIAASQRAGELNLVGFAMSVRGSVAFPEHPVEARSDFDEAIQCFRTTQNSERLSSALCRLAIHELETGNRQVARDHLATVLEIAADLHNDGLLPHVYAALDSVQCSILTQRLRREQFRTCMEHARRVDDGRVIAYAAFGLAYCATAAKESNAAKLYGAADTLLDVYGERLESTETVLRGRDLAELREVMGPGKFDAAYHEGRALAPHDAIALAWSCLGTSPSA